MATFYKRKLAKRVRWTVRVRLKGREVTDTFPTRAAAASWARAQERAIETGEFVAVEPGKGPIFADAVDAFLAHRKRLKRIPGETFANALPRLKDKHGLEPLTGPDVAYWRKYALERLGGEEPIGGATVARTRRSAV